MKTITNSIKTLAIACLLLLGIALKSQTTCAVSFSYVVGPNGVVNFTAFCSPTNTTSIYAWNFGNGTQSVSFSSNQAVGTYTSNGNFMVSLQFSTSAGGGCTFPSSNYTAMINVNTVNAPPPCTLQISGTPATSTTNCNGTATITNLNIMCPGTLGYTWVPGNFNGGPSISNLCPGNYSVIVSSTGNGTCCSTAFGVFNIGNASCNLIANFTASQGQNGLVNFNNTSTGTIPGVTYTWSFGGSATSNATSPAHTYTLNGTYVVTLTANNNGSVACTSTKTLAIVVNSNCNLTAGFNFSQGPNGQVSFFNTSTPSVGTSYSWGFGNSTGSSLTNPSATYTTNGVYTVTLIASSNSPSCSSMAVQTITITNVVPGCNLSANFTFNQGSNGLVNFNNTSTGTSSTTTYSWNFGNGGTSSSTSPANTYTSNGPYVVTLYATNNSSPACTSTKTLTIYVGSICNLSASFNYTQGANGQVSFVSTSTGTQNPVGYSWNFGDNTTGSGASTSHTYFNGAYVVLLTVTNYCVFPTCSNTSTQVVTITNNSCTANANFSLAPTFTAQYWNAFPSSPTGVINAVWSWGDGSSSNSLYTSHMYSASATYDICLSVTVSCGASASACNSYSIYRSSQSMDVIYVNVVNPDSITGIKEVTRNTMGLEILPNPNSGLFNVNINTHQETPVKLSVYDVSGGMVYETEIKPAGGTINKQIDLTRVPAGIYFVKVGSRDGTLGKKIVIDK